MPWVRLLVGRLLTAAPEQIVELWCFRVHQHGGSLQIFHEGLFVQVGQLLHQHLVQPLLWLGFGSFVKENKIFTQFDVGRLVRNKLPDHHHAGKKQHREKTQNVLMLAKKTHEFVIIHELAVGKFLLP